MDIAIRSQKTIVERDGPGVLIMHEDGAVEYAKSPSAAMRVIERRARTANPGATITQIEWRDGLIPPRSQ